MINSDDNKNSNKDYSNSNENLAKKITAEVITSVNNNPSVIKANRCARMSCVIFDSRQNAFK